MCSKWRIATGLVLTLVSAASLARTEVWFGPHHTSIDYYTAFDPSHQAEWAALANSVDVFKFYQGKLTRDYAHAELPHANFSTRTQLQQAAAMLHQFGIKAAFELQGPDGDCINGSPADVGYTAAIRHADQVYAYVENYRLVTGNTDDGVYALSIDAPVEASHDAGRNKACTFNNEQSLQTFAAYVAELRNRFPSAKIGLTTNFANMVYDGKRVYSLIAAGNIYMPNWDYRDVLNQMVARAASVGVTLDFLQIDHPADLVESGNLVVRGNWEQLRDLSIQAHSLGLKVNVIFNADYHLHWTDTRPYPFLSDVFNKYSPPAPVTDTTRHNARTYAVSSVSIAARWKDEKMPLDVVTFQSWHEWPYSVFQDSAPWLNGVPAYHKFGAANIVHAVNSIYNRRSCSSYEYKAQRSDLDAYLSQYSGATQDYYANYHWNHDGAFEMIGAAGDPFALHPRQDPWGNTISPPTVALCRSNAPDVCTEAEYFRRRPDVAADRWTAINHWSHFGRYEGMCQPSLPQEHCSFKSYFMQRPDVLAASGGNLTFTSNHWKNWGRFEAMCKPR